MAGPTLPDSSARQLEAVLVVREHWQVHRGPGQPRSTRSEAVPPPEKSDRSATDCR